MVEGDEVNNDNKTSMSASGISIFQKLEKFSGRKEDDIDSWLRGFNRCCVISNKSDDLVKGQLLLLCLGGQALAVAERFEEEKKQPQNFTALVARLKEVFNSEADREFKQEEFEKRHLQINETEDDFMLALTRLHRAANPNSSDEELARNVKRKFMNGISPELKRNIFIFCSNPHATTISVDSLLEAVRKTKLHILEAKESGESVNVVQKPSELDDPVLKAIDGLRSSLDSHIRSTSEQFKVQAAQINSMAEDRFGARSTVTEQYRNTGNARYQRGGGYRGGRASNRGHENWNRDRDFSPRRCYNCNEPNHIARNCNAPPLNSRGRLTR